MLVFEEDKNQQQTQPAYVTESGNRTRVGGECSHHCAIPAPHELLYSIWQFQSVTSQVCLLPLESVYKCHLMLMQQFS